MTIAGSSFLGHFIMNSNPIKEMNNRNCQYLQSQRLLLKTKVRRDNQKPNKVAMDKINQLPLLPH